MIITSRYTASVAIHTSTSSSSFTLSPGEQYVSEFDDHFFPNIDVESKAIRITSDMSLQVLLYKYTSAAFHRDVYMVPSQMGSQNEYFTSAYFRSSATQCSIDRSKQFYLVSSFYDETWVNVTQQDGTVYEVELPEYGTFVRKTFESENRLAEGTKITASKPINVVSGNLCLANPADGVGGDTYASNIPDTLSLGQEYIVPNIIGPTETSAGYSVSVLATEDQTIVQSDSQVHTLNQGESAILEYDYHNVSVFANCSKPCLVVQYSKSITNFFGLFMQQILSEREFSTSSYFTTLDSHPVSYLSLVLTGESPGDNLYLNGTSLGYLGWRPINGYTTAEMVIPQGIYELDSLDGRPFAAYVYLHINIYAAGAGYVVLPSEFTQSTTTQTSMPSTTPSPLDNLPQHMARVNGTAYTEDGEDMTPRCAVVRYTSKW